MRHRRMKTTWRRLPAVVLVAVSSFLVGPIEAFGEEGLDVETNSAYRIDAATGVVHVTAAVRVENTKPDERVSGGVKYFYFTGYGMPLPPGATNVAVATADGTQLEFTVEGDEGGFSWLDISFARDLLYGKVVDLVISFDVVGVAPRTLDDPTRTNAALSTFPVFTYGDPGKTSVRVYVPEGFELEREGDDMVSTVEGTETVLSAEAIENPDDWYAYFTARNDEQLASTPVTAGSATFEIRSWPGDTEWSTYMSEVISSGLPTLESLVGQPWPHTVTFEVVQSMSPYLAGYAGWYDGFEMQIEIGEDLDDETMLHELAHAWFDNEVFVERWINEGLAETVARQAMVKLGRTASEPDDVDADEAAAVRLAEWEVPEGSAEEIEDLETFGYAASRLVVSKIAEDIGEEKMREVLAAAQAGELPYLGEGAPETVGALWLDWRRFLDLVEERGGSTVAEPLLREWVVTDEQATLLDERAQARAAYDDQDVLDGDWAMPEGIRRSMTAWLFDRAEERIAEAEDVVTAHGELLSAAEPLGLSIPGEIETMYETADDEQTEALELIAELQTAADQLNAAQAEVDAERGFFEKVGLWRSAPQADQLSAISLFNDGKTDEAVSTSQLAIDTYDDAEALGKQRSMYAGGGLGGALLLLGFSGFGLRRRRRRRKQAAIAASGADLVAPAGIDVLGASALDDTPSPIVAAASGDDVARWSQLAQRPVNLAASWDTPTVSTQDSPAPAWLPPPPTTTAPLPDPVSAPTRAADPLPPPSAENSPPTQ